MENTIRYEKRKTAKKVQGFAVKRINARKIIIFLTGFLSARAVFFEMFSPVGAAYLSSCLGEANFYPLLLFVFAGALSLRNGFFLRKYSIALAAFFVFDRFFSSKARRADKLYKAISAGICVFLGCLVSGLLDGLKAFALFSAFAEGIITVLFSVLMSDGADIIAGKKQAKSVSSNGVISLAVILSGALAGSVGLTSGMLRAELALGMLAVMCFGYAGGVGAGAATGVLMGFMLMLGGNLSYAEFCILSVSGLLCGVVRDAGRAAAFLGFFSGAVILAFYVEKELMESLLVSLAFSGIAFILMPNRVLRSAGAFLSAKEKARELEDYEFAIRNILKRKTKKLSQSFLTLSETLAEKPETAEEEKKAVLSLIDNVADSVCSGCAKGEFCWKHEFYDTFKAVFSVISASETKGCLKEGDIPKSFSDRCIKCEEFTSKLVSGYERHRDELLKRKRQNESRSLVSGELTSAAYLLNYFSEELSSRTQFCDKLERALRRELAAFKIKTEDIFIYKSGESLFAELLYKSGEGGGLPERALPLMNKVLMSRMKLIKSYPSENGLCISEFAEEPPLKISTASCGLKKTGSDESGDGFICCETEKSCIVAVSDGMGSGKRAAEESKKALDLLKGLAVVSLPVKDALKLVNSVMILRSGDEAFATLDSACIDLYTGKAEFIKTGAPPSYVLRNGNIRPIRSESLPIGILPETEAFSESFRLESGDVIIMATDGACDIMEECSSGEAFISEALSGLSEKDAKSICFKLCEKIKEKAGERLDDDATVVVAKLSEAY